MSDRDLELCITIGFCAFWVWVAIVLYEYRHEAADWIIERLHLRPK